MLVEQNQVTFCSGFLCFIMLVIQDFYLTTFKKKYIIFERLPLYWLGVRSLVGPVSKCNKSAPHPGNQNKHTNKHGEKIKWRKKP